MNSYHSEGTAIDFIRESNRIEGIHREPTDAEIIEYNRFMSLDKVVIPDLSHFVAVYQRKARLRNLPGLDVRVGDHQPMRGGPYVEECLEVILKSVERTPMSAYWTHRIFEDAHPFTDCNGRSGRMLWLWQMKSSPRLFLHEWYYQTLAYSRAD